MTEEEFCRLEYEHLDLWTDYQRARTPEETEQAHQRLKTWEAEHAGYFAELKAREDREDAETEQAIAEANAAWKQEQALMRNVQVPTTEPVRAHWIRSEDE